MGNFCSAMFSARRSQQREMKRAHSRNLKIDQEIETERLKGSKLIKILLLGPSESGKSTLMTQMRILYGEGFNKEELALQKAIVYRNTVAGMNSMLQAMEILNIIFQNSHRNVDSNLVKKEVVKFVGENRDRMNSKLVGALRRLWKDTGVQDVYKQRNEYQLQDSIKYFLDAIDRTGQNSYQPTQDDILRTRVETVAVVETKFNLGDCEFLVVDAGDQRSKRRKWVHCFENVNAVIFVAAVSEYDQLLMEDETTNRMAETFRLFDLTVNNRWFLSTPMILFLNKIDLFQEKVKRVPITVFFNDYTGPQEYRPSLEFIEGKLLELNQNSVKPVYTHKTCATDTVQVNFVFQRATQMIIENNLSDSLTCL